MGFDYSQHVEHALGSVPGVNMWSTPGAPTLRFRVLEYLRGASQLALLLLAQGGRRQGANAYGPRGQWWYTPHIVQSPEARVL